MEGAGPQTFRHRGKIQTVPCRKSCRALKKCENKHMYDPTKTTRSSSFSGSFLFLFFFCLLFYIQPAQAWPFCFILQRIFVFIDGYNKIVYRKAQLRNASGNLIYRKRACPVSVDGACSRARTSWGNPWSWVSEKNKKNSYEHNRPFDGGQ